ncbi:hypothetical protein OIU85_028253 [Salix viminalis]|uniref:ATP synthase subunit e, mitochondrial n=1 Tax=Salix viminalis TaxID=40686 RepID=A0A9Q0TBV9_SALVM|nr:hypothetical protein OIU85_028253 [Salix viminalis]
MAPPPGPYSGTSTLALVARVSAFSLGLVYGSVKLNETYRLEDSLKKQDASPDGKSGTLILCGSHKFNSRDYTSSGSYALLNLRLVLLNRTKGRHMNNCWTGKDRDSR